MENRITVDVYVEKKLSAEIAELKAQLARMEFQTLVLKEENETLKTEIESLKSRDNEREEVNKNEDE